MQCIHVVRQGECLAVIASNYGFHDYRKIYDDPANKDFRACRKDPNVLFPGDVIVIPDLGSRSVGCATGKSHRFVLSRPRRRVRIVIKDDAGEVLAGRTYELVVETQVFKGRTNDDGELSHAVPLTATSARLRVGQLAWRLSIGALNPMKHVNDDGVTGIQARLMNLGYDPGPVDGVLGPRTRQAIVEFQSKRGIAMPETWNVDQLADLLEQEHGS